MTRYAVLWHHDITEPHFDLLVETRPGSDLATWRSPVWPIESALRITRVKDHRRLYLDYEGELSDWRGRVDRVGGGSCRVDIGEDAVWTLRLESAATTFRLQPVGGDQWEIEPI
jgi:hypothetical protein